MKKIVIIGLIAFNLISLWYLISPLPRIGDLPNSEKSDLPGDTTQLKNVTAFFTNQSRTEIMNFYKANYNGLFRIHLNHPPERAKEVIRDTTQSYYLEEFILPFKESIFINGYDWQNDVFTPPAKRVVNKMIYHGKEYQVKVTIKKFPTNISHRIAIFFLTELTIILVLTFSFQVFTSKND